MSPQQTSEIVEALEQSREEVLAAANAPDAVAAKPPAEGRWSALDCMEHLTRMEASFLDRLVRSDGEAAATDQQKESNLAARMADREEKRQAPDMLRPTGQFQTAAEALEAYRAVRARAIRFALDHASDMASFTATSPRWGVLSGREVMLLFVGHSRRHAAQIREAVAACELAEALEQSRREVLEAANISESLASVRPSEGRWSVLECIEHIIFVEGRFLGRLAAPEGAPPPLDRQKETAIMTRAIDRTNRFQAPEAIHPKGRFTSLDEGLKEFEATRQRTAQFAQDNLSKLPSLSITHPVLGALNGKEALILIAGHSRRHALQMRETAEALARI